MSVREHLVQERRHQIEVSETFLSEHHRRHALSESVTINLSSMGSQDGSSRQNPTYTYMYVEANL